MMEFSFRGPPEFWERILEMAEAARSGGTDAFTRTMADDPGATTDIRITFIGDPVGDGWGALFIPDERETDVTPWLEISDRVAETKSAGR